MSKDNMFTTVNFIHYHDWNVLVEKTYGRPYNIQQQDGCVDRGLLQFDLPLDYVENYQKYEIPEEVNHPSMGVNFQAWLERDPKKGLNGKEYDKRSVDLWYHRNFYPSPDVLLEDMHSKGLLKDGEYVINIEY